MITKNLSVYFVKPLILVMLLLLAACNPEPMPTPPPPEEVAPPTFTDETGLPIQNQAFRVFCHAQLIDDGTSQTAQEYAIRTDDQGKATSWPATCRYVTALQPQPATAPGYDTFKTSWMPGSTTAQDASSGTIHITAQLLVVFNPIVSLAWEPSGESSVVTLQSSSNVASLTAAFARASSYLYDATNGQMLFGNVQIYTNGEMWNEADFRVLADNDRRPSANIGGMVKTAVKHPLTAHPTFDDLIFYPGHIMLGRGWSKNGPKTGLWNASDGFRTLAHEWGHYALFLYDEYLTLDNKPAYCTCPHGDTSCTASIMDWQYDSQRTELWGDKASDQCNLTQQNAVHQESDGQTLSKWFFWQGAATPGILQAPDSTDTKLTLARYLIKPQPASSALTTPANEPTVNVVASPGTLDELLPSQLLAQLYTVQHESQSDVATSILYQGSTMLYPGDESQRGLLTLLGVPLKSSEESLYVGVNQFAPTLNPLYQVDAFSYTDTLPSPDVNLLHNSWRPHLQVQYKAHMADASTQTAVIDEITLILGLDQPAAGPVLAQLCTPVVLSSGSKCYGSWEIANGDPGQYHLTISAAELGGSFPSYSLLRLWVRTDKPTGNPELIRWIEIGRAGAGPGGGCAHAPLQDGNQTRTLGMNAKTNWDEECSGLVAYMPVANDTALQTAVPNEVQGFVSPPVLIQDIPLDNGTCSATKDGAITMSYDDLDVCQVVTASIFQAENRSYNSDVVGLARDFQQYLLAGEEGREKLTAVCTQLLNADPHIEENLRLLQLTTTRSEWNLVPGSTTAADSNVLSGFPENDGIFAIALFSN